MANIQFKISGSSEPFLARVYCNNQITIAQQKGVDFSGSTVTFESLSPDTCYYLKIYDNIGCVITHDFHTCCAIIPKYKVCKTLSLSGTVSDTATSSTMTGTRALSVFPVLVAGDEYIVRLNIITCDKGNTSNLVRLFCNGTALSPYYLNNNHCNCNNSCALSTTCSCISIPMSYGDTLTYDMATTLTNTSSSVGCGCAILQIVSGSSSTFQPLISTSAYCKKTCLTLAATTTTTTTTASPSITYVGFNSPSTIVLNTPTTKSYTTTLKLSKPLTSGQSFKLKIGTCALVDAHDELDSTVNACGAYYLSSVKQQCAEASLPVACSGIEVVSIPSSYIIVNSSNINNFIFCVKSVNNISNNTNACSKATISINGISEPIGGIFSINIAGLSGYQSYLKSEIKTDPFDINDPYPETGGIHPL